MGDYTELIFGCVFKHDVPSNIIDILLWMTYNKFEELTLELPDHSFFKSERWMMLFQCSSYFFGVSNPVNKVWYDSSRVRWAISTRSNLKNYDDEIEKFLDWIKPYIEYGSGERDMYAVVTFEKGTPKLYYLDDND